MKTLRYLQHAIFHFQLMLDSNAMKKILSICMLVTAVILSSCEKDFEKVNKNPLAVNEVDPGLLFPTGQRSIIGNWQAEHTIVQHFVCPYNEGATLGFNFNADVDLVNRGHWENSYRTTLRNLIHAQYLLEGTTDRKNLVNMIRIWKAQIFMNLVDTYGDVPYFDAGKAVIAQIFEPKYDRDDLIYEDIYQEIKSAVASLDPNGDYVSEDLFYGKFGTIPVTSAAEQTAKWKKLGNSLLLRLGMRYSKVDQNKAKSIVQEAFAAGVIETNNDNAYLKYGVGGVFLDNDILRNFSQQNYAAEPFVNQLKETNDPRAGYMVANFANPGNVAGEPNPNTDINQMFGVPIGVNNSELLNNTTDYRGGRGAGLNYSQVNTWVIAAPNAPIFYVTYAQTALLLAEAASRGWIAGDAKVFYENAMEIYGLYPNAEAIDEDAVEEYLSDPKVAFDQANALELINTQYWLVNIRNGIEAFANFRRSGYPQLSPNLSNDKLEGGFVRRFPYPDREASANEQNSQNAINRIGGDLMTVRVFWDKE
jgi:hypothetical protein